MFILHRSLEAENYFVLSCVLYDILSSLSSHPRPAATTLEEVQAEVDVNKQQMTYFGNRICPFAQRAWWTLVEKNADFDYVHVELGAKKPAWYKEAFNPSGTVPSLYVSGRPVFESSIAVEFLEEALADGAALLPKDPVDRAAARQFVAAIDVKPLYGYLMEQDRSQDGKHAAAVGAALGKLEALMEARQPQAGPFLLGDQLSIAEVNLAPFLDRFSVLLKHYRDYDIFADGRLPRLAAAFAAVKQRPAWQKTSQVSVICFLMARELPLPSDCAFLSQAPEFYIQAYKGYAAGKP